jgi:photosystem II stability/assembly factor-like uncharacterized protein
MKFPFHFISALPLFFCLQSFAQWRSIGPDYNAGLGTGRIESIAFDPGFDGAHNQTMYIGSPSGGLWKSTNAGKSWSNSGVSTDGLPYPGISDIVINPQNSRIIYIAQGKRYPSAFSFPIKIYKTLDGGSHWQEASAGIDFHPDSSQCISKLIINPKDPEILYAATSQGIYKTTNAGRSWKPILKGNFHGLEFMPSNEETIYASGKLNTFPFELSIMKSIDAGDNWRNISAESFSSAKNTAINIAVCNATGAERNIYAFLSNRDGSSANDLFISTDGGLKWKARNIPYPSDNPQETSIAVSPLDPEEIYIGKEFEFYKSSKAYSREIVWDAIPLQCFGHSGIHDIAISPLTHEVFVASEGGLQNASNCRDLNDGLAISDVSRIADAGKYRTTILAGTENCGSIIYDGSQKEKRKWKYLGQNDATEQIINRDNPNAMISATPYLGMDKSAGMILCTKDHWKTRFSLPGPIEQGAVAADFAGPIVQDYEEKNAYYFGYNHLYKALIDFDKETVLWTQKSKFPTRFGVDADNLISSIALSPLDHKVIFVSLYTGRIFKTILGGDGGTTTDRCITGCWSEITPVKGLTKQIRTCIALNPDNASNLFIGYAGSDKNLLPENRIMKSIDRINFLPYAEGLPNVSVNDIIFLRDNIGSLLAATDGGVFYRNENMKAWKSYSDSLPHVSIKDIEINVARNTALIASLGRGVWEAPLPFTSNDKVITIDSDETWNKGKRIDGDLVVLKGRILTINSNVSISHSVKITLGPNSKLILGKGGIITNNESWGDAWEGNIVAEASSSITCKEGSSIHLKGKGGILIKSGKIPAKFIYHSGAEIILKDEETFIKVKGESESINGGKMPLYGKGKLL